ALEHTDVLYRLYLNSATVWFDCIAGRHDVYGRGVSSAASDVYKRQGVGLPDLPEFGMFCN
ncbi:hypothetical protein, partial [Paenibacillus amylolyticus]|uniref:hypothetical protein n=1 Tax=Paenibacillus amylolyticus TaxID=1451 RepID=UPI00201DAC30